MTVYVLAQLKIQDARRYQRYVDAFLPVLLRYGGRLLSADTHVRVVEGDWPCDKAVLMSFTDEDHFRAWSQSPEYRKIAEDRIAGASAQVILMHAVSG
ncbi:MAG: DUF1330 domain-containing protein [Alphaproteobacteria bacterium HGW-Alphaproteobacteria-18]|nr:MAG: DUF1330 domain-containing protein [Alphaproteobacteria bacterium HGW-Alphaproteobacteria-18]